MLVTDCERVVDWEGVPEPLGVDVTELDGVIVLLAVPDGVALSDGEVD